MKKKLSLLLFFFSITIVTNAQTYRADIGSIGVTQVFLDSKFDNKDGGTISAGYINDPLSGNGNDIYICKLNAHRAIEWQQIIPNTGDDNINRIIICANGDYVAVGQIFQGGIRRGLACRINSTNGNIIWGVNSSNTAIGDVFWDVVETANQNLAIASYENLTPPQTNCMVLLLNSSGVQQWSFISNRSQSDGFNTINQLPNGNLIVGGIYIESGNTYNAAILEMNELTGAIISQNTYSINASLPSITLTLNTLVTSKIFIKNNAVILQMGTYEGFVVPSFNCIYTYDQITKDLTGQIFYHTGVGTATAYAMYPISDNDFIVASSYSSPASIHVSRITAGTVIFDNTISNSVNFIPAIDINNSDAVFCGAITNSDVDAFNLFSTTNFPISATGCTISSSGTLASQLSSIPATSQSALVFDAAGAIVSFTPVPQVAPYSVINFCGINLPVKLIEFKGSYNAIKNNSLLQWSTSSEFNSKEFIIERSTDKDRKFSEIGSVPAAGTGNNVRNYDFIDTKPATGVNLYRLKQVDLDGRFQYSDIISVDCTRKTTSNYTFSPTPAHSFALLRYNGNISKNIQIDIIDAQGRIIERQVNNIDNMNPLKLNLNSYKQGLYFVRISSKDDRTITEKLLIQ